MRGRTTKLVLALFAAGALSFLAGLIFMETVGAIPCEGEGLACNIDAAVGCYGVLIFAVLGSTIYGVTLLVAPNRTAVVGALGVLLVPILGFYLLAMSDNRRYIGFDTYKSLRTFLAMAAPPALTVIVQWLILRIAVRPMTSAGSIPSGVTLPRSNMSENDTIPFPTE
jgi:hypothetical protein